jgi:hypothetical protein
MRYILTEKQRNVLVNYLTTKPYTEVRLVIPELMTLPALPDDEADADNVVEINRGEGQ